MLAALAIAAVAIAGGVTMALMVLFAADPANGMARANHRAEKLPEVMVGRYAAFTALAFGAAWYGDLRVIAYLFAVFAGVCAFDAVLYRRAGHPAGAHALAGLLCLGGLALALSAALPGAGG